MHLHQRPPRSSPPIPLILGFWSIPVLLSATQHFAVGMRADGGPGVLEAIMRPAPGWLTWALFSIVVLRLAQRRPIAARGWKRAVALHLPLALGMALVHIAVLVVANRIGSPLAAEWSWGEQYASFMSGILHVDLLIYGAILALGHLLAERHATREREIAAAQLRAELTAAQLHALRMQLNPHFLFNSLNAAVTLVRTGDRPTAARMLTRLGDLLRHTLRETYPQEVPLRDELDLISRYIEVEQVRFQDRLRVSFDVDTAVMDARVPSMILQPLVENAIRHAIEPRREAGAVIVRGRRSGDVLELEVADDGPGISPDADTLPGIGLANTRERLTRLYPLVARLDLINCGGGTTARVTVPFSVASAEVPA
jgi:two-component system, LytTR family, sensor kinase